MDLITVVLVLCVSCGRACQTAISMGFGVAKLIIKQFQEKDLKTVFHAMSRLLACFPSFVVVDAKYSMGFSTFREFVQMKEGLWLADKNAVPGMLRFHIHAG